MSNVANEIRSQLGRGTLYMLGAHNLITDDGNNLSFKIKGSKKVNHINIIYIESLDLYTMEFKKIWGLKVKDVAVIDNVYADQMHSLIEENTGLCTSL